MMKSKPSFKCALVTGATSGIGEALAKLLREKGIEVITTGSTSDTLPVDLRGSRQKLLEIISEKKPDLVINNAGFGLYGSTIDLGIQEQLDMIEVNIKALVEISIHAARTMVKAGQKGTILNVSSAAGYNHFPLFNVYSATKGFVKLFSLGLHAEMRDKGVQVLCACPGYVNTKFRKRSSKGLVEKFEPGAMSPEYAANQIWKQIESGKRVNIFNWKFKVLIALTKLQPDFIVESIEKKMIEKVIASSSSRDTSRANDQK